MQLLNLEHPHGTAWELLVVVAVIIAAPIIVEKVRIPGLIGLLIGGCIIGPNVLGIVSDTHGILDELGDVGLLYLMFVAGLELDLAVFARFRKQAISFSMLTFIVPLVLGIGAGFIVDYDAKSALLLGSLFASYTLVVYPTVRNMGLASNRAVAVTVGATVITDTLALVVLAVVSGSTTGDASGIELLLQIALGLVLLAAYCFMVLPRIAMWFFAGPGRSKTLRYMFVLGALLSAGVLAEVVGIEAIVGAFFAGLALNRLVPNEGEFMERIEFFGSALFIPMFLVSVGTVIDPEVMADPATLGLGALFTVACVGGKFIAAALCKPMFGFSNDEVGVVFGLSVAQAAATLAATFVGLEIGLFTTATVNAVMIVVVVSLVLASTSALRFGSRIPKPPVDATRLGRSVLVQIDDPADAPTLMLLAGRLATSDSGIVQPTFVVPDGTDDPDEERLAGLHHAIASTGTDAELSVRHDRSSNDGVLHAATSLKASMVIVPAATQSWLPTLFEADQHRLVAACPSPVALVRSGSSLPTRVVLALNTAQAKRPSTAGLHAAQLAVRFARGGTLVVVASAQPSNEFAAIWRDAEVVVVPPIEWFAANGSATDLLVVPGGRNGALGTAKLIKSATGMGCSIAVVADRESVSASDRAAESLGLVTSRTARI
ncbi:MAG: cation:proton antiporter [Ilumatobacteraceae bacterium]